MEDAIKKLEDRMAELVKAKEEKEIAESNYKRWAEETMESLNELGIEKHETEDWRVSKAKREQYNFTEAVLDLEAKVKGMKAEEKTNGTATIKSILEYIILSKIKKTEETEQK